MDLKVMTDTLVKSFVFGFVLSGTGLITFFMGYSCKSVLAFFDRISK